MATLPHDTAKDQAGLDEPWAALAAAWARVASPLRPSPEDLRRFKETWVSSLPTGIPRHRIDVLIMGVTPEFALFPWADEINLHAIDCSEEMIRAVWPGDAPNRQVVRGDWRRMPFADASFDLIVCDAGLTLLVEMADLVAVASELRRLLRKDGRAVLRHYAPMADEETEQSVLAATEAGKMANFSGLKLRLLLALNARNPGRGVRLGEAWDCFERLFPDRAALADRLGCERATVDTIDGYRGRDGRYIFRPVADVAPVFAAAGLRLAHGPVGHYPFAEYCPVFSLTPIS